jgi:hypothetical protein
MTAGASRVNDGTVSPSTRSLTIEEPRALTGEAASSLTIEEA